jgi:hypothetical protein
MPARRVKNRVTFRHRPRPDLDGLEPVDEHDPWAAILARNSAEELYGCVLSGDLPCSAIVAGARRDMAVQFVLDLRPDPATVCGQAPKPAPAGCHRS